MLTSVGSGYETSHPPPGFANALSHSLVPRPTHITAVPATYVSAYETCMQHFDTMTKTHALVAVHVNTQLCALRWIDMTLPNNKVREYKFNSFI